MVEKGIILSFLAAMIFFMSPRAAVADCTSPNEPEATIEYFSADKAYKFCDGTDWIDIGGGGGSLALDDLTDVVITSPADGASLIYEQASGNWIDDDGAVCDTMPNGFDFTDAVDINFGVLTNSNIIQITGITCSAMVTISGDGAPQYRTCSDASCSTVLTTWTNNSASISVNQYIQLRLTAAGASLTTRTADVNIGSGSADWDVTTVWPKRVFVTSTSYNGSGVGGVAGAHAKCQARATAGGLTGTFKAWISGTSSDDPESTFTQPTQDYGLLNGTVIANGWTDLVDSSLDNVINRDEFNNVVGSTNKVWTGVSFDGTSTGWDCSDWTSSSSSTFAYTGAVNATDTKWTMEGLQTCNNTRRLYCFEQ